MLISGRFSTRYLGDTYSITHMRIFMYRYLHFIYIQVIFIQTSIIALLYALYYANTIFYELHICMYIYVGTAGWVCWKCPKNRTSTPHKHRYVHKYTLTIYVYYLLLSVYVIGLCCAMLYFLYAYTMYTLIISLYMYKCTLFVML